MDQAIDMLNRNPVDDVDATIKLAENTTFDTATVNDFKIFSKEDRQKVKKDNHQYKFPLGI